MPELSGGIATMPADPGKPRSAAFEVEVSDYDVTLTLTDPETGYFLGSVKVELCDNEVQTTIYDSEHENDGDIYTLHAFGDDFEETE